MAFYSAGVEYGIHCLANMLDEDGQTIVMSVKEAAKLQGVPYEYLGKIFTQFSKAGILKSSQGRKGGFELAKCPKEITVLHIVQAIDGQKSVFDCKEIRQRMAVFSEDLPTWVCSSMCGIHSVMKRAQIQMEQELNKHTISMLSQQMYAKSHPNFGAEIQQWFISQRSIEENTGQRR
jgi:Rrf2 family protein